MTCFRLPDRLAPFSVWPVFGKNVSVNPRPCYAGYSPPPNSAAADVYRRFAEFKDAPDVPDHSGPGGPHRGGDGSFAGPA